jgi:hypothetical protein
LLIPPPELDGQSIALISRNKKSDHFTRRALPFGLETSQKSQAYARARGNAGS